MNKDYCSTCGTVTDSHDAVTHTLVEMMKMPLDPPATEIPEPLETERARMIELIKEVTGKAYSSAEKIADLLLAEGFRQD